MSTSHVNLPSNTKWEDMSLATADSVLQMIWLVAIQKKNGGSVPSNCGIGGFGQIFPDPGSWFAQASHGFAVRSQRSQHVPLKTVKQADTYEGIHIDMMVKTDYPKMIVQLTVLVCKQCYKYKISEQK